MNRARKRKGSVRIKVYGDDLDLIEKILDQIDSYFTCAVGPVIPSDKGGYHSFVTVVGVKK